MTLPILDYFNQPAHVRDALNPYSGKFAHCILPILHAEGGLNLTASDRGGLTKYGISQRAYPHIDIANLTMPGALRLYHRDYWRPMHGEQFDTGAALMLLDGAVQHGVPGMTYLLQRLTGAKPDGRFGPRTLKSAHALLPTKLVIALSLRRARKYARICAKDSSQQPNLDGWYNRLEHITEYAAREAIYG
ncbi:secretion activator protein [Pseudoalteromonas rubra]|uniref:Secretion activator protein n=1 Tax=Pseudoalteromonas rubra TaxID=43658 RepID=A0A5S3WIS8_9GAMM|nr:glycosyl hydrolase 108 family protein [Pseudoalteromonas rubra]TMP27188.1 secretion activator protein [Pseudoalteromonas rubra]TMP29484.1 secretion activator protein [Pseudoalteromonas rubra]